MILKKKYFIFLAVLLVAMMSVAVAADVNDSTTESITPTVTHTTDNVDTQTATQASNEITKKINETSIKESVQNTPKTVIVDSTNYSTVFLNDSLSSTINDGDTIDVQGDIINTDLNITINKAINLTTTTGATIYLNTTGGNLLGTNPGNSFKIVNSGSYTNVTNLKFYNTQVFVINAHHVTMDNINVTVENRTVGSGVGVTSIRDNSTYVTVKNSNFYTKNNGGSSSVVLAWADYCTIDNNNITGEGNVGNLMYLTTYNINGTPEYAVDINMYNNITNNNITAVSVTGPCVGVVVTGHDNKFENNKVNVSSSFAGQWMSPTMNEQGDHDDRWEGNSYINNKVYGSFTGTKNSTITDNKFNKTVSLPERCIFKNNNAENFTVTIKGSNCDLCGNRIYHLTVNSGVTNTRVCRDNVFINGYDGSFTWYTHPTSLGLLNKKSIQQVKTEGEPTVITITEENYAEWFKLDDAKRLKFVSGSNGAKTFYIEYLPTNITMLDLYTWYSTSWDTSQYTFIGKNNFNLTNVKLRAWGANVLISNMTLYYDEDYENSGDSFSYYIFIESDYDFVPGSSFVLDNIKINYTGKYLENYHAGVLCTGENQPGVTYQNFEINAKMLSVPDGNELIILERNDKFINSTVNIVENYATADETSITGIKVNSKSVTIKDNNITLTGESTLTAIKLNSNNNTITNNNITVTTTGTANGVELTGNDNTVTDNYILANNAKGDAAVVVNGENNVVKDNIPSVVITENSYSTFFDENSVLREEYNGEDLFVSGLIIGKVFIFDGVNVTITNDGTAELKDCQIMVGNDAQVVFDGLVINNEDMEAILLESSGNVINNSEIIVTSAYPLHAVEIAEDGNIITNTIITATIASADVAYDKDYVGLPQSSALYIS
ncbi:hypothetical protein [Ruminococcus sp.]|uniref:hypothetical protein n=1 Tax=Ruminococcus sp. TaxID=41978 RepID=UPI002E7FDEFB|nr:hypothetical protein [Ruminococcus sp.]MEE3440216.1 hypothetical protein [Ruminococcus sp.]